MFKDLQQLGKVTYQHRFGECSLEAVRSKYVYGITVSTFDEFCSFPHNFIKTYATGSTFFDACCELVEVRSAKFILDFAPGEQFIKDSPQCLERDVELMRLDMRRRSTKLFIPNSEIERLHDHIIIGLPLSSDDRVGVHHPV